MFIPLTKNTETARRMASELLIATTKTSINSDSSSTTSKMQYPIHTNPLILQFTTVLHNDMGIIEVPSFYHRQWAPEYPEFVNFRYDGTIYQIRLRQHRAKVYFAEGLKEFRKDLSIFEYRLPNCVMTHVNACGQHMTILRRFGPPLQWNVVVIDGGVGRKYVVQPWAPLFPDFKPSRAKRKVSSDIVSIVAETVRLPPLAQETKFVKLCPGNVNGLRALLKLEGFPAVQLSQREDFDVLCLQDTKLQGEYWSLYASGYIFQQSPIKLLSVRYGLGISDHDSEGRLVSTEFDTFYLICGYVPNSGDGLKRLYLGDAVELARVLNHLRGVCNSQYLECYEKYSKVACIM
ncbi:hypothetical protein JHK85_004909 [Glycine max]|nr:hypothetical protein JHK85_004909 [Glycine max]